MSDSRRSPRFRRVVIGCSGALVVLVALGVLVGVRSFQSEKRQPNFAFGARFCPEPTPKPSERHGCVQVGEASMVYADILSIDPDQHMLMVRLTVLMAANQVDSNGLATPVVLNVSGKDITTFDVGAPQVQVVEVPLDFSRLPRECCQDVLDPNTSNRVTSYPFDKYDADFSVGLLTTAQDGRWLNLPLRVALKYAVHGWRVSVSEFAFEQYTLQVERSGSTVFFSIFVMVIMWALTLGIVAMAAILAYVRHDIGPGVLGFLAAILFAFPGMRSVLPGAPPLGSLNDYLAFFWCEGIVGVTLLVLTVMFLTREIGAFRTQRENMHAEH